MAGILARAPPVAHARRAPGLSSACRARPAAASHAPQRARATAPAAGPRDPAGASTSDRDPASSTAVAAASAFSLWLAAAGGALADVDAAGVTPDFSKGGFAKESYYVTLGLFLLSLPGLWSQIKRAPKSKRVRKVYEVPGPAAEGAVPLDKRAAQIFQYFKSYNYSVKETGEVIKFVGTYRASLGQAAALVFYVFCGLASTALVLSIAAPGGNAWYALTALSPLAGVYYWQRGTREEEFLVKMTTSDDDKVTDISVEGDAEEAERLSKTLGLPEKGKIYVKGILG